MGGYLGYAEYKDSGVEWLEGVPAQWKSQRLKFLLSTNPSKSETYLEKDDVVSFIPMEAVGEYGGLDLSRKKASGEIGSGYTYFCDGDIVVAKITPCFENGKGAVAENLTNRIAFGTTELYVLRPYKTLDKKYLFYLTISHPFRKLGESEMYGAGGQKRVPEEFIRNLRISVPPVPDQQQIAAFLDYKTAQIDALIAKKEALLEKLAEKRTALISQAVTKGLDPTVEMKDSGIEWLGEIPKHWERKRLKFVVNRIIDTPHKTAPYDEDGQFLVVRTTNVRNGQLSLEGAKYTDESTYKEWISKALPEPGDILFTREAPAGEACLIPAKPTLCLGQRMVLFKFDHEKYDGYFLLQSIYSGIADEFIQSLSLGSTVAHFNMSDIGSIPLVIPPFEEQQKIGLWLQERINFFATQVQQVQQGMMRLKEYRTALITNAVTGKIDVRDIKLPSPSKAA